MKEKKDKGRNKGQKEGGKKEESDRKVDGTYHCNFGTVSMNYIKSFCA